MRFVVLTLIQPTVLLVAAGRLDWAVGWAYAVMSVAFSLASRLAVLRVHPELLAERARYAEHSDVKAWDRIFVLTTGLVLPLLTMVVAGLDVRFRWSPELPLWLQIAALAVVAGAYFVGTWAMVANRFFSAVVRIQQERGHSVATGGPYRFVRHPAYAVAIVAWLVTPLLFSALWTLLPVGLIAVLTIVRTVLEDRALREELPGYAAYAENVRYRLLPGIW